MSALYGSTDTAAKLAATKAVAADANATAIDVLERLGNLNLQIHGLQRNYSELEDTVNTANQMIQDPEKNSKVLYVIRSLTIVVKHKISGWNQCLNIVIDSK